MKAVGICTKNCARTIKEVMEKVDNGLSQYFPGEKCLIIVSDGFSTDGTMEIAAQIPTQAEKLVITQAGGPGKGNGIKSILTLLEEREVEAIALVDGDLLSIQKDWMQRLLKPIEEGYDMVVPFYLRHPYDGVITNQIAYPLTTALFGVEIRQPIGGEFGLSQKYAGIALKDPYFPEKFGIDIFLTTGAIAREMKVVESTLGTKAHTSTEEYEDPDRLLVPMFRQVVGTLFRLIPHYQARINSFKGIEKVKRLGEVPREEVKDIMLDKDLLLSKFKAIYEEIFRDEKRTAFLKELLPQIKKLAQASLKDFNFPLDLWVRSVYLAINAFQENEDALEVLRVLWQGRYLSLVKETEFKSKEAAEISIQAQVPVFVKYRHMLKW